jgi:Plasmid replication region DNA-binding N-term
MTIEDVQAARQAIEQRGEYPSADKILAHLGRGSKKTVLRRLRAMAAAHAPAPLPTDVPHKEAVGGSSKLDEPSKNKVLRESNGAMAPHTAPMPAAPPTLLQQAEEGLEAALMVERRARRNFDLAPRAEKERLEAAWMAARRTREHAASLVEARRRAKDRLLAALPSARVEARRASGELALLEAEMDKRLIRARREAILAEEDLTRIMQDLVSIAGTGAVPREAS